MKRQRDDADERAAIGRFDDVLFSSSGGNDGGDDDDDDDDDAAEVPLAPSRTPAAAATREFSDDDDDDNEADVPLRPSCPAPPRQPQPQPQPQQSNPLLEIAQALDTPVSMLDQALDPHVAVETGFQRRVARSARPKYDGTIDAPVARFPLALDEVARRDRTIAAMNGDERARLMMTRIYGMCPQPTENGLEAEVKRLLKYLHHVPAYRTRRSASIRAQVEQCVVNREIPARWDDMRRYLRWRSGHDDVHWLVEAGWRVSPTHPPLRILSRPCVNAERCMGFRTFPQLAGCPPRSFMPIGYITKEELAHHYATGDWPEGGAGNVPCIFCTWYVPHYLQCAIPLERGNQWLPFVVAQTDFNSVDTYHGYRNEHVLRRSGQHDSIVLAPLAKWDSNAMMIYFDPVMEKHRVNHDRMLTVPMGHAPSLAHFDTDLHPPDATECVTPASLAIPNARASTIIAQQAVASRPAPLPAPTSTRRPEPFFGPGARPQAPAAAAAAAARK